MGLRSTVTHLTEGAHQQACQACASPPHGIVAQAAALPPLVSQLYTAGGPSCSSRHAALEPLQHTNSTQAAALLPMVSLLLVA